VSALVCAADALASTVWSADSMAGVMLVFVLVCTAADAGDAADAVDAADALASTVWSANSMACVMLVSVLVCTSADAGDAADAADALASTVWSADSMAGVMLVYGAGVSVTTGFALDGWAVAFLIDLVISDVIAFTISV